MALLTVTSTGGTNTLTSTTAIAANNHRDFLVVNEGEHSIRLNLIGSATGSTNGVPNNELVSWRLENRSNHGTSVGSVNLGREYVINAGQWVQLSAYNLHSAAQNVSVSGIASHVTGGSSGNRVLITTLANAETGAIN